MDTINDYLRGLAASLTRPSLVAIGWAWGVCLLVAVAFTVAVFSFVSGSVASSAMAEHLRQGQSIDWILDLTGVPGSVSALSTLMVAAAVLVPLYLVLAVFLSGGVVAGVARALGIVEHRETGTFFESCGRYVGPMARLALVEIVVLGIVVTGLGIVRGLGDAAELGRGFSWGWLAVGLVALAYVTAVFDFARIELIARASRSALRATANAVRFAALRFLAVFPVVLLNLVLALVVAGALLWLHGTIDLSTGFGVLLGLVVGQLTVLGRLWARIAAYATEAAVWQREQEVPVTPVYVEERAPVVEAPAPAPESQPLA